MPYSQNGYSANNRSLIASYLVPGSKRKLALRKGDCAVVLLDFCAWYHKHIAPIDVGELDDWGYAERNVRGSSTTLSNHASGTAVDLNSTRHPLGKTGTFTSAQASAIRTKLKEYGGVIRWGGDYSGRKDEMHFEINAGAAAVNKQADRIRAKAKAPAKAPAKTQAKPAAGARNPYPKPALTATRPYLSAAAKKTAAETKFVQWASITEPNGVWDARTTAAVKGFQTRHKLTADGKVGAKTLNAMAAVTR